MASSRGSVDAAPKPLRGPWEGESKIVIGIDIGTTQSGVAFTFLQTGANQMIHRVTRWPGQEAHGQQGKIPTLVWYDTSKKAVSFGAEALLAEIEERAEDNGWFLAKHFKLHLHPDDMKAKHDLKLDALPPGVDIAQIYTDFLRYLLKYTKEYFEDRILDGKSIWERYSPDMEIVIAHPNGWGLSEQVFLRKRAVDAGFSTSEKAQRNIRFLTEAEASVHYCIHHTNLGDRLKPGTNFVVCDAGGSTVDSTIYCVTSAHPVLNLEEKRASACVQAGAIFVDLEAERYLHRILSGIGLGDDEVKEYTKAGMKNFEAGAKRGFQDEETEQHITVASSRFNNSTIRARRGRLTLSGATIKSFFDVCTEQIISSVDQQIGSLSVPHILLVGGFGDSPHIRRRFLDRYEPRGSQITRTNDSTSKVVADGAVIWSIVNSVSSRAPRYSFGTDCARMALPWLTQGRKMYLGANGMPGVALDTEAVCKETYTKNQLPIFRKVCTINADLRGLEGALERKVGLRGSDYWELEVAVCMRFGGTELEAYLEWTDKHSTVVKRSILYKAHSMSNPRGIVDPIPRPFQGTWEGESKIVVGIDIGTTQSGVAFAFLEKGQEQAIQRVTHWPGQEAQALASKIPTLVWYDADKEAVSFGAEAFSSQAEEDAEDNGWSLAKHFKLHLHPTSMRNEHSLTLDPLPPGISLLRVYSDFLGYLLRHTQTFFEDRIIDGKLIWQKHRSNMQFIIGHPNGYGVREQAFLRTAATNAGLVTNATAASCVRFVTEAEASVHYCIYHTNLGNRLQPGMKFAVCDAGGSTVDSTVYSVVARSPLDLEEARASACVQAGGIFVNVAAEQFIKRTLTEAALDQEDVVDYAKRGVQDFEKNLKRQFSGSVEARSVEVAGSRVNYPRSGVRRGHMSLEGATVRKFFDICVNKITASVDEQIQGLNVSHILLVGGLGDSPYLQRVFKQRYEPQGCQITLTNDSSSKAVADGAIIWSTSSNVSGRAPRASFGIETSVRFNSVNSDHQGREIITCPSGNEKVSGIWSQIAAKGVVIDARAVARESFSRAFNTPHPDLSNFEIALISYSNNGEPMWARDKRGTLANGFQSCCTISADLTNLSGALEPRIGVNGNKYWRLYFEVCIRFGGTELEAYLEWEERGTTRTGTVIIIPEDPVEE
ncbi:unnamed protein product [Rhizoctonia solani]|nr:unnamed protein product [Rhizoctonia solani]